MNYSFHSGKSHSVPKQSLKWNYMGDLFKVAGFVKIAGSDFKTLILKVCLFQIPLHGFIVVVND